MVVHRRAGEVPLTFLRRFWVLVQNLVQKNVMISPMLQFQKLLYHFLYHRFSFKIQ